MQSIVINKCYGGFGLSYAGVMEYARRKGIQLYGYVDKRAKNGRIYFNAYEPYDGISDSFCIHYSTKLLGEGDDINESYFSCSGIKRDDPALVDAVKSLGEKANGKHAELTIIEIPDGVEWEIEEYDGIEWIAETHRTWR